MHSKGGCSISRLFVLSSAFHLLFPVLLYRLEMSFELNVIKPRIEFIISSIKVYMKWIRNRLRSQIGSQYLGIVRVKHIRAVRHRDGKYEEKKTSGTGEREMKSVSRFVFFLFSSETEKIRTRQKHEERSVT